MKLFVWDNVLTDYTSGIMFAISETADDARKALLERCYYIPSADLAQEPEVFELNEPMEFLHWGNS